MYSHNYMTKYWLRGNLGRYVRVLLVVVRWPRFDGEHTGRSSYRRGCQMRQESGALAEKSAEISRLYQEEGRGLLRLAVLLVGDRGLAEDLVQEAFVALQRRWESLSDHPAAAGYLRVSVINGAKSL